MAQLPPRFRHQEQVLQETTSRRAFAVFWEQGTGKTRFALDTMVELARKGEIDAMLVLAPSGVHQTWINDEIPRWVGTNLCTAFWNSSKAGTKAHKQMLAAALAAKFSVVAMGYEGFMTKAGREFAKQYLTKRRVLMVLDEATAIKTPNALRTKAIIAAGKYAAYRRILTGTPVTNRPFDVYSPFRFLDPEFWKQAGFASYSAFKTHFGIWEEGYNQSQNRTFQHVVAFRHLDQLQAILRPHSSRVLKEDVLDLPPKMYTKRYFQMSPEQQRTYRELKEHSMTLLNSGELLTTPLVLVQMLRLHQVTSNYLPTEDGHMLQLSEHNPRLECLKEIIEEIGDQQALIWARFDQDIDQIMRVLPGAAQCDGRVDPTTRTDAIHRFQRGELQYLVSKPQTKGMSRGQTLLCPCVVYYNNTFSLEDRLQSEDRPHRAGQTKTVTYFDIVAPGTIDVSIVAALRNKLNIASAVTGDNLKEWL